MAIPSGSGTEVLKRVTLHGNSGSAELFSGTAGHIYTILSIVFCDIAEAASIINITVNDGANDIMLLHHQAHAGKGTFVWNDKFVLYEDDDLDVYNGSTNADWYLTYIDQDWT